MTTLGGPDRFLSVLDGRSERLLALVPPTGSARDGLDEGIRELSERLIAADDELRVQQAQPEDTRRRLADMASPSAIARAMASVSDAEQVLAIAARAAQELIAGAEHTAVLLARRGALSSTAASSSDLAERLARLHVELAEGPALVAVREERPVRVDDLQRDCAQWPVFAAAAGEAAVESVVVVPVALEKKAVGVVTACATHPSAFDDVTTQLLDVLSVQVAVALARIDLGQNLRAAMQTRQLIGQAVGILIERYKLTPDAAFDILVRASQHRHLKLREIAFDLVTTGQDPAW